ncbi:hypothetical protein BUALT_Bualt05G0097400 [Buddleja alternifolia]|uniref:Uncharacterized protein n=1 Tax=Buddleja alternifolia TaxID=168488 RepID=A0AAV6XTS8_9LAMI|nr:hypothetical protein BUALT_Bualt05G0097400 [Buddleja alternifolia]
MSKDNVATGSMARSSIQAPLDDDKVNSMTSGSSDQSRVRGRTMIEDVSMDGEELDGEDNTQRYRNPTLQEIQMQSHFKDDIADWIWSNLGS